MGYKLITANRNYSSWSLRPWVLMKALNIGFEDHILYFSSPAENNANFKPLSPNAMVPCLHHNIDGEKRTVWDSLSIIEYLAEHHDGVWPDDIQARTWARCAAAEMHGGFNMLRNLCPMSIGVRAKLYDSVDSQCGVHNDYSEPTIDHSKLAKLNNDIRRINELWCEGLERFGGPWLAGKNFSAVDAFYAPVVYRFRTYGLRVEGQAQKWFQSMIEHPAMVAWEQEALSEVQREKSHEEDLMDIALITKDYRASE